MSLGMEVDLSPGDSVFDRDPATPRKRAHPSHPILAYIYCGQTDGRMKTPLGTEVDLEDLDPGHIVLYGVPSLRERGTVAPSFRPMSIVATLAHLSY